MERNNFQLARLNYRQQQRTLQAPRTPSVAVRNEVYQLIQLAKQFEIQKFQLILSLRQKDNTQQSIIAPPTAGDVSSSGLGRHGQPGRADDEPDHGPAVDPAEPHGPHRHLDQLPDAAGWPCTATSA